MNRYIGFIGLVALNLLDFYLTSLILGVGGSEGNPIVNMFVVWFGPIGILLFKAPFLALFAYIIFIKWHEVSAKWQLRTLHAIRIVNWLYVAVCSYSLGVYLALLP